MSVTFYSRKSRSGDEVSIWLRYRKGADTELRVPTGLKTTEGVWSLFNVRTRRFRVRTENIAMTSLRRSLLEVENAIEDMERTIGHVPSKDDLCAAIRHEERQEPAGEKTDSGLMTDYCERMIGEMRSGARMKSGSSEPYRPASVKSWGNFKRILYLFAKEFKRVRSTELTFGNCDSTDGGFSPRQTAAMYLALLRSLGYNAKYRDKCIGNMKAFLRFAEQDGLCLSPEWVKYLYHLPKHEIDNETATRIFLAEAEVQALYEMELEGMEDMVRDVFLAGVYTCQRISDYNGLTRDCFGVTRNGVPVVRLTQRKTGRAVVVPILNPNLQHIAEKYSYNLPLLVEQVLNRYIKRILSRLSKDVPSLAEIYRVRLSLRQREMEAAHRKKTKCALFRRDSLCSDESTALMEKWELVSSHTARRTGITNLYLTHKFSNLQLMSVSGHSSETMLLNYIRLTDEDRAEDMAHSDGMF